MYVNLDRASCENDRERVRVQLNLAVRVYLILNGYFRKEAKWPS